MKLSHDDLLCSFRRAPRAGAEELQYIQLVKIVEGITLFDSKDKKTNVKNGKDQSPKYPPGFTPNDETNDNSGIRDKSVNYNADEGTIGGDGVSVNVNSKGDDVDFVSIGRFKKSEDPRSGGSFLSLMEEVVK
ncbi:hypothetical protein Tco_0063313, partial [Tanacetum coccineum]